MDTTRIYGPLISERVVPRGARRRTRSETEDGENDRIGFEPMAVLVSIAVIDDDALLLEKVSQPHN